MEWLILTNCAVAISLPPRSCDNDRYIFNPRCVRGRFQKQSVRSHRHFYRNARYSGHWSRRCSVTDRFLVFHQLTRLQLFRYTYRPATLLPVSIHTSTRCCTNVSVVDRYFPTLHRICSLALHRTHLGTSLTQCYHSGKEASREVTNRQ